MDNMHVHSTVRSMLRVACSYRWRVTYNCKGVQDTLTVGGFCEEHAARVAKKIAVSKNFPCKESDIRIIEIEAV